MLPNHQCDITIERIPSEEKEDDPVVFKRLDGGYAETKRLAFGIGT